MPAVGSFIGNTVGEAAAFAAGLAVGPVLAPLVRALENEAWSEYPDNPLAALTTAQGVAEGKIELATGQAEGVLTGTSNARFAQLVDILKNGPGVATGFQMLRRGQISATDFVTVLQRAGLEEEWITAYQAISANGLKFENVPLPVPDIALGMVRNNVRNADSSGRAIFPGGLDSTGSTVPQAPIPDLDPEAEAAMSGYDLERFTVLANNVGLPPGIVEGLQMLRRGFVTEADFALLVEQSDLRIAWGPKIIQLRDVALTAHDYVQNRLRGWDPDVNDMYAGGALTGQTPANMDILYNIAGRPLSWHQVWIGLQRGGTYDGPTDEIDPAFLKALQESDIRPEWYNLVWAQRYTLPSYFVLKNLVPSPISVADATTILLQQGWRPDIAADTANSWGAAASSGSAPTTKTATNAAVTATGKRYIAGTYTQDEATAQLQALGLSAEEIASLFAIWNVTKAAENPSG